MKTKDYRETVRAFLAVITKSVDLKKLGSTKEQKLQESLIVLAKLKKIEYYSTMSETKAAFAERTIRTWKNLLYRYMEDYGYKEIHKLTRFVRTLNSRKTFPIDLLPKKVRNSDFLSIRYSNHLREDRKPKFEIDGRVRISLYDLPSLRVISHSIHRKFLEL